MKKSLLLKLFAVLLFCLPVVEMSAQSALNFTGTNGYVAFGSHSALGLSQFTIECWFKRTGTGVATSTGSINAIPLVAKGRSESEGGTIDCNYFLGIKTTGNNVLCADFEEGSNGTNPALNHPVSGTTVILNNIWYHAAATYDGATWKLYLNGLLEATLAVNQPVQNLSIQHAAIGSACNSTGVASGFFAGVIDEVRIWSTARTLTQIQSTINSQFSTPQTNMAGCWGLNTGTGTTVTDATANNLIGTITGTGYSWTQDVAPFNLPFISNVAPTVTLNNPANKNRCAGTNSVKLSVNVADANVLDALQVKFYGRLRKKRPANFSIIGLPDTQYYSEESRGSSNANFKAQTNWIVSKKDSLQIMHVAQLGDCVENGDNGGNDIEWKRADTSMKIIENPLTTNLPFGLSYTMNVGNHDQTPNGSATGTTTFFNQYFGIARFSGRPYWGGNYGSNADNSYQLFSANGIDFIVVSLEFDINADPLVLAWANNLLQTYASRKAIIVSHFILNSNGTYGAQGQAIYNALKANPNLFLMLCGHVVPNGENRRYDTYNGNTVHTLLSDFQDVNGGDGWMRIMSFSPNDNTLLVKTYSPTLNQYQTDANSEFTISNLKLFQDPTPYQLLSTQNVTGSGTIEYTWNGLLTDSLYEWYATVADAQYTSQVEVSVFGTSPGPAINLGPDVTLQCGQSATLNAGNPTALKLWSTGGTTSTITVNTAGTYSVVVTDPIKGCVAADTVAVSKLPLMNISGLKSSYLMYEPAATLSGIPAGGIFSGKGISGNQFNPSTAGVGGPYTITYTYTDANNCASVITAQVSVNSLPTSIVYGSSWKYKDDGSNQDTAWRGTNFIDTSWASGNGQLGYGDGDETTILNACGEVTQFPVCANKYSTYYFRKQIYIANVNAFKEYQLNMLRDDGIVVYINGNEVYRNNMPAGTIGYTTLATASASDDGNTEQQAILSAATSFLVNGLNTIAVEVHQNIGSSADLTFDMQFGGRVLFSGETSKCVPYSSGSSVFSVPPVIGATSYNWSVPTGLTIIGGQGTPSIIVNWTAAAVNAGILGSLCVDVSSIPDMPDTCVQMDIQSFNPTQPNAISGPAKVCPGNTVNYSVASVSRATSYTWVTPPGMEIISGQGSNMISAIVGTAFTGGTVSVTASNVCGISPVRSRTVSLNTPSMPGGISGLSKGVCNSTVNYSISAVAAATEYLWTTPVGSSIAGANNGLTVAVNFSNAFTTGSITVAAVNACGTSASRTLVVNGIPAVPGVITGPIAVCRNTSYSYSVALVPGANSYTWTAPTGSSIVSGQGTKIVVVSYGNTTGTNRTITAKAVNTCGTSGARSLSNITVTTCPRIGDSDGALTGLQVYPNPAHDKLNVLFDCNVDEHYNLQLSDATGRAVLAEEGRCSGDEVHAVFDVYSLARGIYMVQLKTTHSTSHLKVVLE